MTVRRLFFTAIALAALLWGAAGCSEGNGVPTLVETDEPFFVQAMQLKKQGRHGEAAKTYQTMLPLINFENRQCGLRACKTVMMEGGVFKSDAVRHPLTPLSLPTRAALLALARPLDPIAPRWGK